MANQYLRPQHQRMGQARNMGSRQPPILPQCALANPDPATFRLVQVDEDHGKFRGASEKHLSTFV